jgi:hypothetical protein
MLVVHVDFVLKASSTILFFGNSLVLAIHKVKCPLIFYATSQENQAVR